MLNDKQNIIVPQYILVKDLPDRKAGTIFTWNPVFSKFESEIDEDILVSQWDFKYVVNNQSWFKPINKESI
jgi:hypothetical protein